MKHGILFLLLFSFSSSFAAGNTGLAFLKIGAGARATAMGEAYTAAADDATSLFWNPAGSAWSGSRLAHFTHNEWIQGITNEVANISLPAFRGSFGIGLVLNSVGGIERRTFATDEPLDDISAHDFSILLNYSRMIGQNLSVGLNAKFIDEKIYIESARGFAVDLGVRYQLITPGLFLGAALQNLGSTTSLAEEKIALPTTARLGAAYVLPFKVLNGNWLFAADFVQIFKEQSHFNIGSEFSPFSLLRLRIGYQTGYEEKGLSAGFGLALNRFQFDYAYVPFSSDLGSSQRLSLTAQF
ncbi:MAG: PorV/PorQ family protein [Actinobacteria bacterium]|nr:PorV/PorQ family protein [Actinomycetota bacterium]